MANRGAVLATKANLEESDLDAANFLRVQSISAYLSSIETSPEVAFPLTFAEAHKSLANVFLDQAVNVDASLKEFYLVRAIASCEAACHILSKDRYPQRWANIQTQLGRIFIFHASMEGVESPISDMQHAKKMLSRGTSCIPGFWRRA
jgi:hypothetical protein